ncbi:unnamed protein product [Dibothriocephalus latus]|uniref:Uncharacterized protein n=1 Tax=Dibothriocephalus latus TaxID=60516 RepID=A0A3P7LZI0_DIBLA|nr:unnamed protein product [Dibothriocephalus latus]
METLDRKRPQFLEEIQRRATKLVTRQGFSCFHHVDDGLGNWQGPIVVAVPVLWDVPVTLQSPHRMEVNSTIGKEILPASEKLSRLPAGMADTDHKEEYHEEKKTVENICQISTT